MERPKTGYDAFAERRTVALPDDIAQEVAAYHRFQRRLNRVRWMLGAFIVLAIIVVGITLWSKQSAAATGDIAQKWYVNARVVVADPGTFGDLLPCNTAFPAFQYSDCNRWSRKTDP